jgi:hypothetical protein
VDENTQRRADYVGRVQEETQRIIRDLMRENERLRRLAATIEHDNNAMQKQLMSLSEELDRHHQEKLALHQQLETIERESRRYGEQFAEVEKRSADLANLYVSSYQLHGTLDREAVLNAIREIIVNLIGSEQLAVFEITEDGSALELVTAFGVDEDAYRRLGVAAHPIGKLAAGGEIYLSGRSARPEDLPPIQVCIPLKLDGRVTGAIVLLSLLPHKLELQELDFELFDLLGTHAATALYCTALHARVTACAVA